MTRDVSPGEGTHEVMSHSARCFNDCQCLGCGTRCPNRTLPAAVADIPVALAITGKLIVAWPGRMFTTKHRWSGRTRRVTSNKPRQGREWRRWDNHTG